MDEAGERPQEISFREALFEGVDKISHPQDNLEYEKMPPPKGGVLVDQQLKLYLSVCKEPIYVVAGEGDKVRLYKIGESLLRPNQPSKKEKAIFIRDINREGRGYGYIGNRVTTRPIWQSSDMITGVRAVYLPSKIPSPSSV